MSRTATPAHERVLRRLVVADTPFMGEPCWIFTGALSSGYGHVGQGSTVLLTHRVMYEAMVGPIPEGSQIDHLCRVPSCCNPAHLEPVTRSENARRGLSGARNRARSALVMECVNGHAYTPANTYTKPNGARRCVECNRIQARAYQRSRRAAA